MQKTNQLYMNLTQGMLLQSGKYKIICQLGQGGFGITYLAEQTGLGRKVAIKEFYMAEYCQREGDTTIITSASSGCNEIIEQYKRKFIKEARTIASLSNPHIIQIYDIFEENNTAYYVMEYLEGGDLKARIPSGGMDEPLAINIIRQIADALAYVHKQNILHLDVKPSNVIFRDNHTAVLIDFGIAKHYDEKSGGETSSTPVGLSEGYAPLEQYENSGVITFSPATDIYSLGATLYNMLTGQYPPSASYVMNMGIPALPSNITSKTAGAVEKAMAFRMLNRPQTINAFLSLLEDENKQSDSTIIQSIEVENNFSALKEEAIVEEKETDLQEVDEQNAEPEKTYEEQPEFAPPYKEPQSALTTGESKKNTGLIVGIIAVLIVLVGYFMWPDGSENVTTNEIQGSETSQPGKNYNYIDLATADNGVYAVTSNGRGIKVDEADNSCIAVALIVKNAHVVQHFWIQKENTGGGAWDIGVVDYKLPNLGKAYGNASKGFLPQADGTYHDKPHLPKNCKDWTDGALADFSGFINTKVIKTIQGLSDTEHISRELNNFNQKMTNNKMFSDWYIPAAGQMALMALNITQINEALEKIGGEPINGNYWTSTECSKGESWGFDFNFNYILPCSKSSWRSLRLIRNIE